MIYYSYIAPDFMKIFSSKNIEINIKNFSIEQISDLLGLNYSKKLNLIIYDTEEDWKNCQKRKKV